MKWPTMDEFAQMVADKALDEVEYNGKTIREWTEIILATDINVATKDGTDCISREQAIDAIEDFPHGNTWNVESMEEMVYKIRQLPPIQHDKDKVSDLLYHIYLIQSPHLDMNGVIAKKYYCEELWKELFGKESELPGWMN